MSAFPTEKLLPSSPYCCSWKEVTMPSSCLRSGNHVSFTRGQWIYINYLEFFCLGDLFSPHLFIHLIIYINMDSWVFILHLGLNFNSFSLSFFFSSFSVSFFFFFSKYFSFGNWLLCPFDMAHHFMSIFLILYFWMLQGTLGSSCIFHFSKNLWFLLLKKPRPGYKVCSLLLVP